MPINVPNGLPAVETLSNENIFVMDESIAVHQDIRALKIVILNIMPTKEVTETQLLRLLSNTSLQVEIILLMTASYKSKNTPAAHLDSFYKSFSQIKNQKFDGLIITGAPVEQMEFGDVNYWDELCGIMEWSKTNVYSTFHICWGAQAGLFYHYGIKKYPLQKKIFGVFNHKVIKPENTLVRGFDGYFLAPHSRHTEIKEEDIYANPKLEILAKSDEAGVYIVASNHNRQIFVTGHCEYDFDTLAKEYFRDKDKGLDIDMPVNYFPGNDDKAVPVNMWRGHAHLMFSNWLNYSVYQETLYNIEEVGQKYKFT